MEEKTKTMRKLSQWKGAGFWNVYFILKFALAAYGYLNLNWLYNVFLLAWIVFPIANRWVKIARSLLAMAFAVTLLYSESWLPSIDSLTANAGNIADFSLVYLAQIALDAINWTMVGVAALVSVVYLFIKDWLRVTAFTSVYLLGLGLYPQWIAWQNQTPAQPSAPVVGQTESTDSPMGPAQIGTADTANIDRWLRSFYDYEATRKTVFPQDISATAPFDILLVNICSLSDDDLTVAKLSDHPVLKRFDVYLDGFNSATAYSGPATLRLLTASCGQPSHQSLYETRRPECELMNRLEAIGYEQKFFMDHEGKFDDYIGSLQSRVGLKPGLADQSQYRVRYTGFDGEPIFDDADVFDHWFNTLSNEATTRTVTLFNLIALHDGNRNKGSTREMAFEPRAKLLLDQLQGLMKRIEESGRRVMMIVVPEHGAAVKGDKIQMARLRDIPSPHITQVPTMVKFFGLKDSVPSVHVSEDTSYLAVSELIARSLEMNVYGQVNATEVIHGIAKSLPKTYRISENANAAVINFQGRHFVRFKNGEWLPYQQ